MTLPGINWNTGSLTTSFKNDVGSDYLTPTFASGLPTLGNSSLLSQGSSAFEKAIPGLGGGNPYWGLIFLQSGPLLLIDIRTLHFY